MYRWFENRKDTFYTICIFLFAFVLRLGLLYIYRNSLSGGDTGFYLSEAKSILKNGLSYYIDHISTIYYWGYPTFLAITMKIFGMDNLICIAVIQVILAAFAITFLYQIGKKVCGNYEVAFFMALWYSAIFDVLMWDPRILSDSLGMTLEILTMYFFYAIFMSAKDCGIRYYIGGAVAAFCFFITRTNSMSLLLVLIIMLILMMPKRQRLITLGAICFIAVAVVFALIQASDGTSTSLAYRLQYVKDYYSSGTIVSGRPEYDYHVNPAHIECGRFIGDCIIMTLLKYGLYWSFYLKGYGTLHIIINCITIIPLFLLGVYSCILIIKRKVRSYYPCVIGILSYSVIQSLTEIDFDMRYRAPVFVLVVLVGSYGGKEILRRYCKKGKKNNGNN